MSDGKRVRRTRDMKHVKLVEVLPEDGRYIPLKAFMAACPASKENKVRYKNIIHYLLERQYLDVIAKQVRERARRLYNRDQIPLVRQMVAMHQNGLTLEKAYEIARRRHREKEGRLF
ncbi:MAG: MerR family transcriptional regulator [Candidatus Manganitrophaceae bacterium]|nr:MAG: MerR family transcriptional regulator [Candidatus Manganitrophaceae bacterium]